MEEEGRRVESREDFIFLFAKGLFILLLWLTVHSCICMYLEALTLVKFSSLLSSSILRVYKQHVIDRRDKECLPFLIECYVAI